MKNQIKAFFDNEILSYLFFGGATTLISILSRLVIYRISHQEILATILANIIGILFAFITNDTIVFKQKRKNWPIRLVKFFLARLSTLGLDVLLTYIFVTSYPDIIGQFVNDQLDQVNAIETLIAQVLIIILNYIFSKVYVFYKWNRYQQALRLQYLGISGTIKISFWKDFMKMLKDLKEFLLRGNVVDLAVGVIIASAFGAIVTSFVNDIITPLLLNPALEAAKVQNIAELAWNGVTYGKFLSAIINFLVVGTVLFFVIKAIEKAQNLRKKEEVVEEAPAAPTELEVLQEIKALLEKK